MNEQHPRRPFAETHPHLAEFSAFLPKLNEESDRGMVLIGTSFIDEMIRRIILAFMVEGKTSSSLVDGDRAPLGSLAARCGAAFALGLITDREKQEADRLRRIRNRFAHYVDASFEDDKISKICDGLTMAARPPSRENTSRGLFMTATVSLILNLTNRAHYVGQRRCRAAKWKL